MREYLDHWMTNPRNRKVVLPAVIGAGSAILAMIICYIVRGCCRFFVRFFLVDGVGLLDLSVAGRRTTSE